MKDVWKKKKVLLISLTGVMVLMLSATWALNYLNTINLLVKTAEVNLVYETLSINDDSIRLSPILDSEIDNRTDGVLTVEFTTKAGEKEDTNYPLVYDIALVNLQIDCNLLNSYLKWHLIKNGEVISTGNFDPSFDTIKEGRLVLTDMVQTLPKNDETADSYKFQLWLSDSCQSTSLTSCSGAVDQSNMINKLIKGEIEVELYTASDETKANYELTRTPSTLEESISNQRCQYYNLVNNLIVKANSLANQDYSTSTEEEQKQMYTFSHEKTEQTPALTDYRFIRNSPDNYIYYNCTDTEDQNSDTCEVWRIIGVFPTDDGSGKLENRVKIISGTGIAAVNTEDSSIQYTFSYDSSDLSINSGLGINQWGPTTLTDETTAYAGADLMQLLNNGAYYNRTTGDCYIGLNNSKITCDFNSSDTRIKTRGLLDTTKSVISQVKYYLGATSYDNTTHYGTGAEIYIWERGSETYNTNKIATDVVRTTSWLGEVALMYPSDYAYTYAYGVDDYCYDDISKCGNFTPTNSWIYNSNYHDNYVLRGTWTLSSYSATSYNTFFVYSSGYFLAGDLKSSVNVRPVVHLESDILIRGGSGSYEDPYELIY